MVLCVYYMDIDRGQRQQFYQEQCIQLRRELREADLRMAQGSKEESSCVFLVLGPPSSGKSSLLQTLQLALNGSHGWGKMRRGAVSAVQVKRGARWQVEGVREVTHTDRRYAIVGLQLHAEDKPCTRYKKALEYVHRGMEGCLQKGCQVGAGGMARVCLVCLDVTAELSYEELTYLRFLKVDLTQRHIKLLFLLTKTDQNHLPEGQHSIWVEGRIRQVMKDLDLKERDDVIVFHNYCFPAEQEGPKLALHSQLSEKVQSNEQINYYALQLILRIMKESERVGKAYNKTHSKSWICGWT